MKIPFYIISLSAAIALFISQRCYINTTASLPVGLYLKTKQPLKIGSIVVFHPDLDKHPFAAKYLEPDTPLMKRVAALPGRAYQLPPASDTDSKDRPITPWTPVAGIVPARHIIVIGDTKFSLDSRYLGLIPQSSVIDTVTPFFIWSKSHERCHRQFKTQLR
jgi:conjugative transfer signal peptidase TraF